MTTTARNSRFDMRMTSEQRKEIERAAALKGKTLTQWALDNLLASARRDIEEESVTRLSGQSFDAFVDALDKPLPEEALRLLERKRSWQ